jgi:hypothetical protein
MQIHPALYGDNVVWTDISKDKDCIYGRNLSTSTIFKVTTGLYNADIPASLLSSEVKPGVIESDAPFKEEPENGTCISTSFLVCIIFRGILPSIIRNDS